MEKWNEKDMSNIIVALLVAHTQDIFNNLSLKSLALKFLGQVSKQCKKNNNYARRIIIDKVVQ